MTHPLTNLSVLCSVLLFRFFVVLFAESTVGIYCWLTIIPIVLVLMIFLSSVCDQLQNNLHWLHRWPHRKENAIRKYVQKNNVNVISMSCKEVAMFNSLFLLECVGRSRYIVWGGVRVRGSGVSWGCPLTQCCTMCCGRKKEENDFIHTDLELVAQVYICKYNTLSTDIHYSINFEFTQQQANNCTTNYLLHNEILIHHTP